MPPIDHQPGRPYLVTELPEGFTLPNVRADVRELAQQHSRELQRGPSLVQFIQDELADQRRADNERLMQPYVPLGGFQARRLEVRPIPLVANPTVRLSDIRTRRFDIIERTVARLPEAIQRILSALLGRTRPEPEKPAPEPARGRYERLKSDLPEL